MPVPGNGEEESPVDGVRVALTVHPVRGNVFSRRDLPVEMSSSRQPAGRTTIRFAERSVERAARILLRGFAVIVPFVVMLFLFDMALGFVQGALRPVVRVLEWAGVIRMASFGVIGQTLIELGFYDDVLGFFTELIAVLVLVGLIVFLGVFVSFRLGRRTVEYVDAGIAAVPGVGGVYQSLRRMGDIALESGLENFRSVKLLEFPQDGHYSLAFETNRAPHSVEEATGEADMVTLFVPLAPNPVMGGFLINASRDRIIDVDMTVEEAARALVTSGIAAGDAGDRREPPAPLERVRDAGAVGNIVDGLRSTGAEDGEDGAEEGRYRG